MIGQYMTVHGDVISHVNISHVDVEDGGEYTCTAENRAGKMSHSARLNIYGNVYLEWGARRKVLQSSHDSYIDDIHDGSCKNLPLVSLLLNSSHIDRIRYSN